MKKYLFLFFIVITACSTRKDINEVLQGTFVVRTIPQNDTIEIELNKKYFKEILILLHENFDNDRIKKLLGLNDIQYEEKINFLYANSLIKKKDDGAFVPSCMIMDFENQKQLKKIAKPIGKIVAEIVVARLPMIRNFYSEHFTKVSSKQKSELQKNSFEDLSLFLLSNVVLNKWQLENIQERFIKSSPPKRGNKNFYAALFQLKDDNDSLIYSEKSINDSMKVYSKNFFVKNYFNVASKNFYNYKNVMLKINKSDEKYFEQIASIITKDLIENLDKQKPKLVKYYLNSVYKEETSFWEWLNWLYQFIIAEATDELIREGYIKNNSIIYFAQQYDKN
ncbi:MAG: hypothetical protein QHH13_04620 [Melioribacter sp.]|uniref:hypothetical protein n=1 Tax=Rosettibacter primus TaxID=3111523 RepID=UPI00247E04A8|nr:hypothetical protein [Melioribacter sp.]